MPIDPATWELGKDPAFLELGKSINGVITMLKQQGQTVTAQQQALAALSAKAIEPKKESEEESDDKKVNINELENEDFFKFLMKEVGGVLDTKLGTFEEKLTGVTREFRAGRLGDEATKLKSEFKDFNDWMDDMSELAKVHTSLSLKQLYNLARTENLARAKELDTKYQEPEKKSEKLSLFGGYKPSAKDVSSKKEGEKEEKLDVNAAFEKSWAEALEAAPQLANAEESVA